MPYQPQILQSNDLKGCKKVSTPIYILIVGSIYVLFERCYNIECTNLPKHMSITGMMRRLSLIGIDAIWQLSLGCLLMRTIASFLRYTGYLNFINGPISYVLLLILVHVQLLSFLFF